MDSSASIGEMNYVTQKDFIKNIVSRFDISQDSTRVGVVTFSNTYNVNIPLGSANSEKSLHDAIDAIPYMYGMTNTADAIRFVRKYGFTGRNKREGVAQIAIVMTDGLSRKPNQTKYEATKARKSGIYMFAIGIGSGAEVKELMNIGSEPSEDYVFHVTNFGALDSIKDILATKTCNAGPIIEGKLL